MFKGGNRIFNQPFLMNKLFCVKCIDDSCKPEGMFNSNWIKKGKEYTIKEALSTGEMLAFSLKEITPTPPYNSYLASRFDVCDELQPLKCIRIPMGIGFIKHEGKTIPAGFVDTNGLVAIEYDTNNLYRFKTTISNITIHYGTIHSIVEYVNANFDSIRDLALEQLPKQDEEKSQL